MGTQSDKDKGSGKWVMVAATAASAMAFIDGSALNVILPSLQIDLDATATDLLWIVNAYLLFLAALILPGGTLGDIIGRKKIFMWGIALFMISSLSCGLAPTSNWMIISRGVQGIGGGLMVPGSLAIISSYFKKQERGKAIGTWSAITTMVTVVGPALGGFLADLGWWRAVFFINMPLGTLALLSLYYKVPKSKAEKHSKYIDWQGAVLIVIGLGGLTYAFISAPEFGWANSRILIPLLVGSFCLIAFLWNELRIEAPMVPPFFFKNMTFLGANLITLLLYAALNAGLFLLALNLVQVQGYSQLQAGLAISPFGLMIILFSRKMGKSAAKYGPKLFLGIGPIIAGVGFFLISKVNMASGFDAYWSSYFPGVIVLGIGMAITVAPLTNAVMSALDDQYAGAASGVNNAVSRVAGVLSISILGALAISSFTNNLEARIEGINLTQSVKEIVLQETEKLGAAKVPEIVRVEHFSIIDQAFDEAFLNAFSLILCICSGLAIVSGIISFLIIPSSSNNG